MFETENIIEWSLLRLDMIKLSQRNVFLRLCIEQAEKKSEHKSKYYSKQTMLFSNHILVAAIFSFYLTQKLESDLLATK